MWVVAIAAVVGVAKRFGLRWPLVALAAALANTAAPARAVEAGAWIAHARRGEMRHVGVNVILLVLAELLARGLRGSLRV